MAFILGLKLADHGLYTYHQRTIVAPTHRGESVWAEGVAHELGHFLVAPKSRRYKTNYGLAGDPEYAFRGNSYPHVSDKTAAKDESAASIVGIYLLSQVGLRKLARDVWREHSWHTWGWQEARRILRPHYPQANWLLREAL